MTYKTDQFARVVLHLVSMSSESEWIEFKENNSNPEMIGERLSAVSNSALMKGVPRGFLVWGIRDADHAIVGTSFNYRTARVGNEDFINWLHHVTSPCPSFHFEEGYVNDKRVVMLVVPAAAQDPVRFRGTPYVRVGSVTKRLDAYSEITREFYDRLRSITFEREIATEGLSQGEILARLHSDEFYALAGRPHPMRVEDRIKDLCEARLIIPRGDGDFDVTNLGAVLFAHDLAEFRLERKALRIISYRGVDRLDWQDEYIERSGYAAGFRTILEKIEHALPKRETLVRQLRRLVPIYPMDAIRELVANALIHQDFSMTGTGPMVEIFKDRVQVTNPGSPLVEPERFIDKRRSRNEATALAMRHLKICEERGSGIDRVIKLIEDARMPAPLFRRDVDHTEATLLAPKAWEEMTPDDRVRACFQHAALLFEQKAYLSNGSLRERFALEASRASALSRVISDTVRAGKIVKVNDAAGKRHVKYQPFYAAEFLFQDDVEHDDDAT